MSDKKRKRHAPKAATPSNWRWTGAMLRQQNQKPQSPIKEWEDFTEQEKAEFTEKIMARKRKC